MLKFAKSVACDWCEWVEKMRRDCSRSIVAVDCCATNWHWMWKQMNWNAWKTCSGLLSACFSTIYWHLWLFNYIPLHKLIFLIMNKHVQSTLAARIDPTLSVGTITPRKVCSWIDFVFVRLARPLGIDISRLHAIRVCTLNKNWNDLGLIGCIFSAPPDAVYLNNKRENNCCHEQVSLMATRNESTFARLIRNNYLKRVCSLIDFGFVQVLLC